MQKVLFTGATGYLGSRLMARCCGWLQDSVLTALVRRESNTSLLPPSVRVLQVDQLGDVFPDTRFDTIVHCATHYGRQGADARIVSEANFDLPVRLLELGLAHGLSTFVNVDTLLPGHVSSYSETKARFREHLQQSSKQLKAVNVQIEHFYGPGEEEARFVSWIVGSLLKRVPKLDLTSGVQFRDFVHIEDVLAAFRLILSNANSAVENWQPFEIGSGSPVQVRSMVEMVKQLTGNTRTELNFGAIPYRRGEPMEVHADLRRLRELGWESNWPLERGLKDVISKKGASS